ncbi:hypothetical protein GCM10020229_53900 [Kitasatospora albolonga]|uniref:hypothetical protein n=1 Tax=Kitasatospora albolonga TaxID=68173 RepID=UPI0031E7138F
MARAAARTAWSGLAARVCSARSSQAREWAAASSRSFIAIAIIARAAFSGLDSNSPMERAISS